MPRRPEVVAFDVIETLFSLAALRPRFQAVGLRADDLESFLARTLRDGFALTASGVFHPFRAVAAGVLTGLRCERGQTEDPGAVGRLLDALIEVRPCADVEPAFIRLREEGMRILLLTQGGLESTREMLRRHRLDAFVERVVSIEEVGRWKPCREVYDRLVDVAGGDHARVLLVSAHDWDVHGASRAGLATAWVKRPTLGFSPVMGRPDVHGGSLVEVAQAILRLPPAGADAGRWAHAPPAG